MRFLWILAVLRLMSYCTAKDDFRPSEKVKLASAIRFKTIKKLQDEMGLLPFGFGGQMMYQIEKLCLTFQYRQPVDEIESRKMLIQAAEIFLAEINSNEPIRKYLCHYPFEPQNIEIVILLAKPDGRDVDSGELQLIALRDGVLQYKYDLQNSSKYRVRKEPYEAALEILRQETPEREAI